MYQSHKKRSLGLSKILSRILSHFVGIEVKYQYPNDFGTRLSGIPIINRIYRLRSTNTLFHFHYLYEREQSLFFKRAYDCCIFQLSKTKKLALVTQ